MSCKELDFSGDAHCEEGFSGIGSTIRSAAIIEGHLACWDCIHCDDCEEVNPRCVANYIHEGKVVHLIEKELKP